jgi:hypothetical protein
MTEAIPTKKLHGLPPGRCDFHAQPGDKSMNITDPPSRGQKPNVLDFGDYAEVETDGVASMAVIGCRAWIHMFRWRRIDLIWQPVLCLAVSRPLEGLHDPLPNCRD